MVTKIMKLRSKGGVRPSAYYIHSMRQGPKPDQVLVVILLDAVSPPSVAKHPKRWHVTHTCVLAHNYKSYKGFVFHCKAT